MYNITNRDHIGNYMEYLVNIGAYNNIYKEENRTAWTDKGKGLERIEYCNRCYCLYDVGYAANVNSITGLTELLKYRLLENL